MLSSLSQSLKSYGLFLEDGVEIALSQRNVKKTSRAIHGPHFYGVGSSTAGPLSSMEWIINTGSARSAKVLGFKAQLNLLYSCIGCSLMGQRLRR